MSWISESIRDEAGQADIAYISIGGLVLVLIGTVVFLCTMSAIAYARCDVIADVGQGVRAAIACPYDPNPLGLSIAACLGAFGSPISALALYMNQTRRQGATKTTVTATPTTATVVSEEAGANPLAKKQNYQGD